MAPAPRILGFISTDIKVRQDFVEEIVYLFCYNANLLVLSKEYIVLYYRKNIQFFTPMILDFISTDRRVRQYCVEKNRLFILLKSKSISERIYGS